MIERSTESVDTRLMTNRYRPTLLIVLGGIPALSWGYIDASPARGQLIAGSRSDTPRAEEST
jgi:hypothetical protein